METIRDLAKKAIEEMIGPYDFAQTSPCGRGQHHPHALVGVLWKVKNPLTVDVGDCFMNGRLKTDDLWLCIRHSGDCFQTYMYVKEYANCLIGKPEVTFESYGIGDSESVGLGEGEFERLVSGGRVERKSSFFDDAVQPAEQLQEAAKE